jgi:tetratricopeptide (TPR) repeat protein
LIERLRLATQSPLCVIDAPVGFGKSTLLAQFLEVHPREHIFYDVAPDATLAQLARGFADVLNTRNSGARLSFASAYDRAAQSKQPSIHLARWLIEHLRDISTTIIVDGINDASDDPIAMDFVARLVDGTYPHIRWIVATRSSAFLRIPSWMAHGVMERSIDVNELRFDSAEGSLLAKSYGLDSSPNLEPPIGGWAAGIDFALNRSLVLNSAAAPVAEGDYESLAADMFTALPPTTQNILLATCLLAQIDIQIASEVAAVDVGPLFIELIAVFPWMFSLTNGTLRYHDRFKSFLVKSLTERMPDLSSTAARLAGALYAHGHVAQALILLTRFSRSSLITTIIESHGLDLIERGHAEVVEAALAASDRASDTNPHVMSARAMLDSRLGRTDTAEAWYRLALDALKGDPRRGDIAYRYAHQLVHSYRTDWIELLKPYIDDADLSDDVRAMRASLLAQGYSIAGSHSLAHDALSRAFTSADKSDSASTHATVNGRAAFIAFNEGDAATAKEYASKATDIAIANGLYEVATSSCSILYVIALDLEDDADEASEYLVHLADYSIKSGNIRQNLWALTERYSLLTERGDESAASRIWTSLRSFDIDYLSPTFADSLLPNEALSAAWRGHFSHAHALLRPSVQGQVDSERRALRWAELAFYAAVAGLEDEVNLEITNASDELRQVAEITPRSIRAELILGLALLLTNQSKAVTETITRIRAGGIQTSRIQALTEVLDAFLYWWNTNERPEAFSRSLLQLETVGFGGIVRAIESIPVPPSRNLQLIDR